MRIHAQSESCDGRGQRSAERFDPDVPALTWWIEARRIDSHDGNCEGAQRDVGAVDHHRSAQQRAFPGQHTGSVDSSTLGDADDQAGEQYEADGAVDEDRDMRGVPWPTARGEMSSCHADDAQAAQHVDGQVAGWGNGEGTVCPGHCCGCALHGGRGVIKARVGVLWRVGQPGTPLSARDGRRRDQLRDSARGSLSTVA